MLQPGNKMDLTGIKCSSEVQVHRQAGLNAFDCYCQSPDISLIDNLWQDLKLLFY